MARHHLKVCFLALFPVLCFAQDFNLATRPQHSNAHKKDSYVLVLGDQAIARGRFEDRESALNHQQASHISDFVWYSTADGCFVLADAKTMATLKEAEKPWHKIKWGRTKGASQIANRLIRQRDETIWTLFDELQNPNKLTAMKVACTSRKDE